MTRYVTILALCLCILLSSCSLTESFVDPYIQDASIPLAERLEASGGVPVQVPYPETYYDAKDFLERYVDLISSAEDYILITTFLGSASEGLEELYAALAERARAGVDVYMVMDGISSFDMTATAKYMYPLYFLRESGVHLIEYGSLSGMMLIHPTSLLIREHRKMVVVDGRWCVLGGMNMNYISLGADNRDLQRDSMYVFDSGELAAALVDQFVTIWNECSVDTVSVADFPTASGLSHGSTDAWLFNQGPGSEASVAGLYASLFASAEDEIVILPYLAFFNDDMYACLEAAMDRGVSVKIYLPVDSREYVQGALFYDYHRLVEAGFEVYTDYDGDDDYLPLLHEKLCVVDERYVVIGSSNFNFRSMGLSYEIALVLDSPRLADASLRHIDQDIAVTMQRLDLETALALKEEKGNFFSYLFSYYGG